MAAKQSRYPKCMEMPLRGNKMVSNRSPQVKCTRAATLIIGRLLLIWTTIGSDRYTFII